MSVFRDSLAFFDTIGLFDVVLPFLLVFTLVFGVLEKSRIFGTEKMANGNTYSRKNLNAMVAFCTGFFVVASAQLVGLINVLVARVALILVILVMFMILVASMHKQKEGTDGFELPETYKTVLTATVLVAVILIFMDGVGWLTPLWGYVIGNWNSQLVGTIALFGIIVGFMVYLTKEKKDPNAEPKKNP